MRLFLPKRDLRKSEREKKKDESEMATGRFIVFILWDHHDLCPTGHHPTERHSIMWL